MLGQELKIEKREHPWGEAGVRLSLEEVAKKVVEGYQSPKVRAWAIECLERARREEGRKANTERERAEILLRAVQRKLWTPDPVGTEFMTGAHLMACDRSTKDEICFLGGDCDDVTILLPSCFMSVGLYTLVVGHAYDKKKNIEHVLCAVRVGKRWHYADPSTDFPLSKCVDFTRERIISLPDMKVRCDDDVCLRNDPTKWDPDKSGFVTKGMFVGVNGIPEDERPVFTWLAGPEDTRVEWLGVATSNAAIDAAQNCKGTSRAELRSCAQAAAGAAAGAFCAEGGPVAVDICSSAAANLAGPIFDFFADVWSSLFGDDSAEQERARRAAEEAQYWEQNAAVRKLEATLYERADQIDHDLLKLAGKLNAGRLNVLDMRTLLVQLGLKTYAVGQCSTVQAGRDGAVAARDACLGVPPLYKWWFGAQRQPFADVMQQGIAWLVSLEAMKKKAAVVLVADAAAAKAQAKAQAKASMEAGSGSSSKSKAPLVIGALAVAGGVAYYVWGR